MSEVSKRRRGRPSKGVEREVVRGDVPVTLARRFKHDADQRNLSDADFLAHVLTVFYSQQQGEGIAA